MAAATVLRLVDRIARCGPYARADQRASQPIAAPGDQIARDTTDDGARHGTTDAIVAVLIGTGIVAAIRIDAVIAGIIVAVIGIPIDAGPRVVDRAVPIDEHCIVIITDPIIARRRLRQAISLPVGDARQPPGALAPPHQRPSTLLPQRDRPSCTRGG
ncbi:hypothetical protein WR25_01217 [Diploscapter pachys]|uniref:Uncharacterized protein n=1 Tax=Diploscapter pachys TaxID=2018661 RepID=A0A2A2M4R1_9BILA|nr:hypothetical protein WR25_01217 [Diploscapter pachys]